LNVYEYCGDDPVNGVDQSGCISWDWAKDSGLFIWGMVAEIPLEVYAYTKWKISTGYITPIQEALAIANEIRKDMAAFKVHDRTTFLNWLTIKFGDMAEAMDVVGSIKAGDYYEAGRRFTRLALTAITLVEGGAAVGRGCLTLGKSIIKAIKSGSEIKIGNNFRLAPFGNRTGHSLGEMPHYHRRGPINPNTGQTVEGQGIGRHRPWQVSDTDKSFWDRF
jgi:hypothetical protein